MPLEATHIRFALSLQDQYEIKNIKQYIAGTVYPDSHYITGIKKNLTHDIAFLSPEFASDDFRKGWQVHQICDMAFEAAVRKIFSDLFFETADFNEKEVWIKIMAIRIILDAEDMQAFDIQQCLRYLKYYRRPNNEDISKIKRYNEVIADLYKGRKVTTIDDNISNLLLFAPNADICQQTKEVIKEYSNKSDIIARIRIIHKEMLNNHL